MVSDSASADAGPVTVGVLEDDDDLRAHIVRLIEAEPGCEIAFAAATLADAIALHLKSPADVCLVDIQLPDGSGVDFTARAKAATAAKVLILSVLGDRRSVLDALAAGADGYLLKDSSADQISRAIKSAAKGAAPMSARAAAHLLDAFRGGGRPEAGAKQDSPLTERERDVLNAFARGCSYKSAATALGVSTNTIAAHVKAIYSKLNVTSRAMALMEAGQKGWLDDSGR